MPNGEHDRLRTATSADHDRLSVGAGLAEPLEQSGQLGAHLPRGADVMGLARHGRSAARMCTRSRQPGAVSVALLDDELVEQVARGFAIPATIFALDTLIERMW